MKVTLLYKDREWGKEESYFDKDINELRKIVTSKAYNGVVFVEHDWKKLKKSKKE